MATNIYSKEYIDLTQKLKKARLGCKMSQNDVALILNKPQSYISKIEKGERRIDIIELKCIAKIYNKKIDYFI